MCFVAHPMEIGCAQDRKVIAVNAPVELIPPTKPAAFLQRFTNLPVLSVKRTLWRMEEAEHTRNEADALFQEARKKALTRDGGRCWCIQRALTDQRQAGLALQVVGQAEQGLVGEGAAEQGHAPG